MVKRELYEQHGVAEYWIVDPAKKQLRLFLHRGGRFAPAILWRQDASPSTVLPGLEIDLANLLR